MLLVELQHRPPDRVADQGERRSEAQHDHAGEAAAPRVEEEETEEDNAGHVQRDRRGLGDQLGVVVGADVHCMRTGDPRQRAVLGRTTEVAGRAAAPRAHRFAAVRPRTTRQCGCPGTAAARRAPCASERAAPRPPRAPPSPSTALAGGRRRRGGFSRQNDVIHAAARRALCARHGTAAPRPRRLLTRDHTGM